MKRRFRTIILLVLALSMTTTLTVAASDMSCAQWMAYREGDRSLAGAGLMLRSFLQGYIDATNEFADTFNGLLISEVSPGKFEPTPPTPHVALANIISLLDRQCTDNPQQSVHVLAVNAVQVELARRATPIVNSMTLVLSNLNKAKGYK